MVPWGTMRCAGLTSQACRMRASSFFGLLGGKMLQIQSKTPVYYYIYVCIFPAEKNVGFMKELSHPFSRGGCLGFILGDPEYQMDCIFID